MISATIYTEHHESADYLKAQAAGVEEDFVICDLCERFESVSRITRYDGLTYCEDCAINAGLARCSWCGEIRPWSEMEVQTDLIEIKGVTRKHPGVYCIPTQCYAQSEQEVLERR